MKQQISTTSWLVATFSGWLAGFVAALALSQVFDAAGIEHLNFHLGAGMGLGVGLLQWLRLRRIGVGARWMWYSAIGLAIPYIVLDAANYLFHQPSPLMRIALGTAAGGIAAGLLQFTLLGGRSPVTASGWALRCFLGWTSGALGVAGVDYTKYISDNNLALLFLNLTLLLCGGVVLGLLTAKPVVQFSEQNADASEPNNTTVAAEY